MAGNHGEMGLGGVGEAPTGGESDSVYPLPNFINEYSLVYYMTPKAKAGNRKRCNRWRVKNREAYNAYMRAYRKK